MIILVHPKWIMIFGALSNYLFLNIVSTYSSCFPLCNLSRIQLWYNFGFLSSNSWLLFCIAPHIVIALKTIATSIVSTLSHYCKKQREMTIISIAIQKEHQERSKELILKMNQRKWWKSIVSLNVRKLLISTPPPFLFPPKKEGRRK